LDPQVRGREGEGEEGKNGRASRSVAEQALYIKSAPALKRYICA